MNLAPRLLAANIRQGLMVLALASLILLESGNLLGRKVQIRSQVLPLLRAGQVAASRSSDALECSGEAIPYFPDLTSNQRYVIGSMLLSMGCTNLASSVMPDLEAVGPRRDLLAYQLGRIAWLRGDEAGAVELWRQGHGVDKLLLLEASKSPEGAPIEAASKRYELAIMASASLESLAESITAYEAFWSMHRDPAAFESRLQQLDLYFGEDTAVGQRLAGEISYSQRQYRNASERFSKAIALGFQDSETWYLIGASAASDGDHQKAESAYNRALAAKPQIAWRRPWYLYSLGALLLSSGRVDEAIQYLEEAVRIPQAYGAQPYYSYPDLLSIAYRIKGDIRRAQENCALAAQLAEHYHHSVECSK